MRDIITEIRDGVATATFNRPSMRNALSGEMIAECADFLKTVREDSSVRCFVLRGMGEHFSGGGDVRNFKTSLELETSERRLSYEQRVRGAIRLFDAIEALPIPVVTVVRGAVAGGGMSFILASDVALVSDTAFFVFAHSRIGLAVDTGLSYYLPRAIGVRRARELTLLGGRLDAAQAQACGLISGVIADESLDTEADAVINALRHGATVAFAETKRLINASPTNDVRAQIELEAEAVGRCAVTADFEEGVSAFMQKRKARFSGT